MQGDPSSGPTTGRYPFSGRPIALGAACRGGGTLFVIVGWSIVSPESGPTTFDAASFPCDSSTIDGRYTSRLELESVFAGETDIRVFVVEPLSSGGTSYSLSIEERES